MQTVYLMLEYYCMYLYASYLLATPELGRNRSMIRRKKYVLIVHGELVPPLPGQLEIVVLRLQTMNLADRIQLLVI
jgi:hypothetical protein